MNVLCSVDVDLSGSEILVTCLCGCGATKVDKNGFSRGHSQRVYGGHNKGNKASEETKLKQSKAQTGKTHPEEVKKKIGDSNRGKPKPCNLSKEQLEEYSKRMLGNTLNEGRLPPTDDTKQLIGVASKRRWEEGIYGEEYRQLLSDIAKKRWADPEFKERAKQWLNKLPSPTNLESKLFSFLCSLFPFGWIYREYYIGRYRIDFAIPSLKLVFEADGDYWHSRAKDIERDNKRDKWLESQGWTVERYNESWLKKWINN